MLLKMQNMGVMECLDTVGRQAGDSPAMLPCHGKGGNQVCKIPFER